jgi:type II secretory pathway pseudopilin PulG
MVVAIIALLAAVAVPTFASIYSRSSLEGVMVDLTTMIREAKELALDERYYAITFNPESGLIALVSDRGEDGEWNTPDDVVVRSFSIHQRGGSLAFGDGGHGPLPGLSSPADGISFGRNALVCNPELTGNAGTVYIYSPHGPALAIVMNSTDLGYKIYRWQGGRWVRG